MTKLSRLDTVLLIAIILVNGYTICLPLVPAITFWWQQHFSAQIERLSSSIHTSTSTATVVKDNRLVIPSMAFNGQVFEGRDMRALRNGVWRLPWTSSPDKNGNTVIVGHRFTYTNPRGDFYHLDKVKTGDEVALYWQQKRYLYKVTTVEVVPPSATEIEASTTAPQLTLYTCTPLWWPHNRLVVIAKLESVQ